MSTMETNIAMISTLPEADQEKIFLYLSENFFEDNPFKPMSKNEILSELAEAREAFSRGEYQDFDAAAEEISREYGI